MSKKIVIPGELVSDQKKRLGQNVFLREGKIYSECIGLISDDAVSASVVCLEGKYIPREGDLLVGVVQSEKFAGYVVDIGSFYPSFISKKETREMFREGTVVSAKVSGVNELNEVSLTMPRAFFGGELISVSPVKIPRIIGREGSMLNVLKEGTGCSVVVGKNGRLWVKGGNVPLLVKAIQKIEDEAHLENLTNRITDFLAKEKMVSANNMNSNNVLKVEL